MQWTRGAWLGIMLAPLLLAACAGTSVGGASDGTSTTPTTSGSPSVGSGGGHERLACTVATSIVGVDVIRQVLTCTVSGAPASETSMTLSYHAEDGQGRQTPLAPACTGVLRQGAGSCTQTYSSPAPIGSAPGLVTGVTEPHHYALGSVVPTRIAGTPQGPGSPLLPNVTPVS